MRSHKLTVAYFGNYDPLYTRVRTIVKGLRKNGVHIIECRANSSNRFIRLIQLTRQFWHIRKKINLVLVSEGGQAYVPLAKLLTLITRKPLFFDVFISYYHVKAIDTKSVPMNSLRGKYYYYLDKWSCVLADKVFLDTEEHINYFSREFDIDPGKFAVVPVGSDDEWFKPSARVIAKDNVFLVFLVTSFYPIHGVEHVVRAAKLLESHSDISFMIVGNGFTRPTIDALIKELGVKNIDMRGLVPPYVLPELMERADLCLGQFGDTEHAQMVIPAKVYDALAMAKPIITGRGRAISSTLKEDEEVVYCPLGDAQALADAILALKQNQELREHIKKNGHALFVNRFAPRKTGQEMLSVIRSMGNNK